MTLLRVIQPDEVTRELKPVVRDEVLDQARMILDRVRLEGLDAIRGYAEQFGECAPDQPIVLGPDAMCDAYNELDPDDRMALERAADRSERFAIAQREAIQPLTIDVPGGQAGHTLGQNLGGERRSSER